MKLFPRSILLEKYKLPGTGIINRFQWFLMPLLLLCYPHVLHKHNYAIIIRQKKL